MATGAADSRLAGATREVQWLSGAFEQVERVEPADPVPGSAQLAEFEALHFAGHTTLDDRYPWRSGIDLGGSEVAGEAGVDGLRGGPPKVPTRARAEPRMCRRSARRRIW